MVLLPSCPPPLPSGLGHGVDSSYPNPAKGSPLSPSRSPEKLTGNTMPTDSTPTATSSPMMCLWKDR